MTTGKNRFVFVACSYNMSRTLPQMLMSIVGQSYDNWKVCVTDDVSDPEHIEESVRVFERFYDFMGPDGKKKLFFYGNTRKKWEVENVLTMIRADCEDNDIVCRIDADDWLTELDALAYLNALYEQTGAEALWTAHRWAFTDKNISGPMPQGVDVYQYPWVSSHLKTFRKRLINGIPYENFTNQNGDLVRRAGDQCLYLPVLHKAQKRGFVPRVMYHYTIDEQGGAVYQTDDAKFQKAEADFIRARGYVTQGKAWEDVQTSSHSISG